uniref:N-Acetyltransferase 1 n=1 Tax=Dematophora necatrix TaxID=2751867 RepID=UPI0030FE4C6A
MATTTNPTNSPASSVNLTTMENPPPSVNPSSMENQPASVNPSTTENQPASVHPSAYAEPTLIDINTTQPLLAPSVYSKPLISERLIIRTYVHTDLLNYYTLDSQPEPNVLGHLNHDEYYSTDLNSTLKKFNQFLTPWNKGLYYGIFTKKPDGQEDDYIGAMYLLGNVPAYPYKTTWPSIHYMLKKEYWGQGYGTEAVKTFTSFWWSLPRVHTAYPRMDPSEIVWEDHQQLASPRYAVELLKVAVESFNKASLGVLQKAGFEIFKQDEHLIHLRLVRQRERTQPIRDKYKEGGRIQRMEWSEV